MVQPINLNTYSHSKAQKNFLNRNSNIELPTNVRNYTIFDQAKVNYYVSKRENAIPELENILKTSSNEKEIVESLYIFDRMIDSGVKGIDKTYPTLSRFNDSKSANIQTFLAGIYRKTQVPDAFGPLVVMLIKNALTDSKKTNAINQLFENNNQLAVTNTTKPFDPNEEIGGAILEYIKNWSNNSKSIDFKA